jgi:large subunit ribosomal protein L45
MLQPSRGLAGQARAAGVPSGAYQPSMAAARGGSNVRVSLVSSNILAEPYKGEPPSLPLSAWVTPTGWRDRWKRWMGGVKSIYTIAKLRKNVEGWSLPGFKEDALNLYKQACTALAAGDRTALRQLVTPAVFTDMKKQLKTREDGGWARVEWELLKAPTLKEIEVVQGRLVSIDPKNDNVGFAQLTVRFKSKQRFAAYDGKGRLAAGEPEGEASVDDYWVFERPLGKVVAHKWRVAARLTVPSGGFLLRD